jgi:hypothetical protein
MTSPLVTTEDRIYPTPGRRHRCLYCNAPLGDFHAKGCAARPTKPEPAAYAYARINTEGLEDEMPSITREDARPKRVPWLDRNPWWAGVIAGAALVTVLWICNEFRP